MIKGIPRPITMTVPVDLTGAAVEMWVREIGGSNSSSRLIHSSNITVASAPESSEITYTMTEAEALSITGSALLVQCRWISSAGENGTYQQILRIAPALWGSTPIKVVAKVDG